MLPLKYRNRFWSKVVPDRETGCWIWQDAPNAAGYGQFGVDGTNYIAHRLALTLNEEELLPGFVVHHRCHVKLCVRPDHLEQIPPWYHSEIHANNLGVSG